MLPTSSSTRSATLAGQQLTGLVDVPKVLDLFDGGATVVLQGLHRYWPPLTELVRGLELSLGHACQANAYLTPPGSQGFAVHSDSHDVFVFQTHGTKQWEVHDDSGARQVLLEPGTSMYLPTGTPHAARAQDAASLHVTVGVHQTTWRDVLSRVAQGVLSEDRYDGAVPAGFLDDPTAFHRELGKHLAAFQREVAAAAPEPVVAGEVDRFLRNRNPALRGGLADRVALSTITDETVLKRRATAACRILAQGERLRVLLGDREVWMPLRLEEAMRYVAGRDSFSPIELSTWLDQPSRLVLARRLVREGLLRVGL